MQLELVVEIQPSTHLQQAVGDLVVQQLILTLALVDVEPMEAQAVEDVAEQTHQEIEL
jgi:hypothetical protein